MDEAYGQFASWRFRNMVREEFPCQSTPIEEALSHVTLAGFLRTRLLGRSDTVTSEHF